MKPPKKPFESYHWRWATATPTEGLNEPPIFLGVLRVLRDNEGLRFNAHSVNEGLSKVVEDVRDRVNTRLDLVRTDDRNIMRNSGQYWRALGVLIKSRNIALSELGQDFASGMITRDEFAAIVIRTLELPNRLIETESEVSEWDAVGLRIKPLQIIIRTMNDLGRQLGPQGAYLTTSELVTIVIPLAGDPSSTREKFVSAIALSRQDKLQTGDWPDCATGRHDVRMAREFLLFLTHYGVCRQLEGDNRTQPFLLENLQAEEIPALLHPTVAVLSDPQFLEEVGRQPGFTMFTERTRTMRLVAQRPSQGLFRQKVLSAYRGSCILTGERIPETLEAAHIIPVGYRGSDAIGNSFCLRSDIHSLFDCGHIRVSPDGSLLYASIVQDSSNYLALPKKIQFPSFVEPSAVAWRFDYQ